MSKTVSIVIGDIIRWLIALIILPIVVWLIFLFFMYPFEWLLSISTKWYLFFHLFFWFFFGSLILGFSTALGVLISYLSKFLVRQTNIYASLLFIVLLILVGFCIYGAWSDYIEFSWENLPYPTLNRIIFTISVLGILQIPRQIFNTISKE